MFIRKTKKVGLKKKILGGLIISSILMLFVALFVAGNMNKIKGAQAKLIGAQKKEIFLEEVYQKLLTMEVGIRSYTITLDPVDLKPFSDNETALSSAIESAEKMFEGDSVQLERIQKIKGLLSQWITSTTATTIARKKLDVGMYDLPTFVGAVKGATSAHTIGEIKQTIASGIQDQKDRAERYEKEGDEITQSTASVTVYGIVVALVLSFVIQFFITKGIHGTLAAAVIRLEAAEKAIDESSDQLVDLGDSLRRGAQEMNQSLASSTSALTEISSMIQQTSDSANSTMRFTTDSLKNAESGNNQLVNLIQNVESLKASIGEMVQRITDDSKKMAELGAMVESISEHTKIIDEIVFQTKLLSFNASVEAARAGEHGKGFSVVAEEVGNLATISGQASSQIAETIENSTSVIKKTIDGFVKSVSELAEDATTKVEVGARLAEECGRSLQIILESSNAIKVSVEGVSVAVSEQADGVRNITQDTQKIDTVSGANLDVANKVGSQADGLRKRNQELKSNVQLIKAEILGGEFGGKKSA